ncbi:hypothetical protein KIH86_22605 [Paenibacillus sp. HN-1]|uniref:hypothetical protein n=1 Tax=Paenibacillus TaxID=44249 RepID=UPI001CA7C5C7|nr:MULTISPECIES: hypothetical protein [Paenibacillus]MBY9079261.1 hypothetical protein [Paenibacillus sp. CGMCC 1.18879]MBY9086984.1 hypothetical protein [Paenibacillus sinensis]
MEEHVKLLAEWLEEHIGETVVIEKQEMEDSDKVYFKLDRVDYRDADSVIDDYLDSALILHGTGSTMNGDGELVALPGQSYEIAVSGLSFEPAGAGNVAAKTERAKYTLTIE